MRAEERASSTFLAHVMKRIGCVPSSGDPGGEFYYLPLGLHGVVKNTSRAKALRDAIDTCPPLELGRNYFLNGKDIWALITNNKPLPEPTTGPVKGRTPLCTCVKKLLKAYGFKQVCKVSTDPPPRGACEPPLARRRRTDPVQKGQLQCSEEGWEQTLAVMQFLACRQRPLKFIGFQSRDRDMLYRVDRVLERLPGEEEADNAGIYTVPTVSNVYNVFSVFSFE